MIESEFKALFNNFKTPLAEIGFSTDLSTPYTCRAKGPSGIILEFGGDRYSPHLTCSVTGPFAKNQWLVFPFVADVIDPEHGKKLRAAKNSRATIQLVIEFLRDHAEYMTKNYAIYCDRYTDLLRSSGIPDFS